MSEQQDISSADVASVAAAVTPGSVTQNVVGPDPDHDGWNLVEVVCGKCGHVNRIHEQLDEWLAVRHPVGGHLMGVNWECNACGHKNNLGGEAPYAVDTTVYECSSCHSTFAPSRMPVDEQGRWTCPVDGTTNPGSALLALLSDESASGAQTGGRTA